MQIAAIIVLSAPKQSDSKNDEGDSSESPLSPNKHGFLTGAREHILGNNLLDHTIGRLRKAGVQHCTVVREGPRTSQLLSARLPVEHSIAEWRRSVIDTTNQGADRLLFVHASEYTELNFEDLIEFHAERKAAFTQARATDGPLEIVVADTKFWRTKENGREAIAPKREQFFCEDYVNRLCTPADFMRLVKDALRGRCNLRPVGTEVTPGVWLGDEAVVDSSCVLQSPCFVGAKTYIGACVKIADDSAIEHDCKIDSGTKIEQSWIFPHTYVGLGLNVRGSIVTNQKLFHLDRTTEVAINDRRLIGASPAPLFAGAASNLLAKMQLTD